MSAEASGPAMAEAPSLEAPKPSGLEPGSAAYGLKPLTPSSKYVKLNVGGSLHYTTLRTLTGQDTMLKAMFSGRAEVLTDAGGMPRHPHLCAPPSSRSASAFPRPVSPTPSQPSSQLISPPSSPESRLIAPFSFIIPLLSQSFTPSNNQHLWNITRPPPTGALVSNSTCHFRIFITRPLQFSHPLFLSSDDLGTSPAVSSTLPGNLHVPSNCPALMFASLPQHC